MTQDEIETMIETANREAMYINAQSCANVLTLATRVWELEGKIRASAGAIASAYNEGFHAHRCVGGNPLDLFKTSNARRAIGDILEASQ